MVNLVLQQKNSGCAVLNGPGGERLTVPRIKLHYVVSVHFSRGLELSSHGL